nr:MAG TPA: hypothetical protein [Caudoviricetes sp.]DAX90421.1 MAG TPA: hypothetical protein [Caudoviricetes sp.]
MCYMEKAHLWVCVVLHLYIIDRKICCDIFLSIIYRPNTDAILSFSLCILKCSDCRLESSIDTR